MAYGVAGLTAAEIAPGPPLRPGAASGVRTRWHLLTPLDAGSGRSGRRLVGRLLRRRRNEEAKLKARTASEAMTSPPVTAHPSMPVAEAATLMLERGVDRLVVVKGWSVDGDGEDTTLVGIVTRGDCVRAFARPDDDVACGIREIVSQYGLSPYEVRLSVNRGEVALDGELERRSEAEGLADAAARVPGVVSVKSMLTWRLTDTGYPNDGAHLFGP
jgi:CBS domain-containing protein